MTADAEWTPRGLGLLLDAGAVEAALWRKLRFEDDPRCRGALFERHVGLARAIARREWRRRPAYGLERVDFDAFAITGLLEAIDRFDPLQGPPFEAFARRRIRGAIADGVAHSSEAGAQYAYRRRLESERIRSFCDGNDGKDAVTALADIATGLAIGLIAEDASRLLEDIPSPEADAYESRAWREMQHKLLAALATMDEPQRMILQQHYLNGVEFADLARLLGLSRGRVSQLHRAALMALRVQLRYKD